MGSGGRRRHLACCRAEVDALEGPAGGVAQGDEEVARGRVQEDAVHARVARLDAQLQLWPPTPHSQRALSGEQAKKEQTANQICRLVIFTVAGLAWRVVYYRIRGMVAVENSNSIVV